MKINTDGVLLGAIAKANSPKRILDIGTGTGVISLMLAQRFNDAIIDAVEIDEVAAATAAKNFANSPFHDRVNGYSESFKSFFDKWQDKKYDMIVSNPPFYIHSLKSATGKINVAKHADNDFFFDLVTGVARHLVATGICCLILPVQTASLVREIVNTNGLHLHKVIYLYSFKDVKAHREIIVFGPMEHAFSENEFVIYDEPNVYSKEYRNVLNDFLTIF
ncbi:MAG: tRNA1(Val) (adenine(37)-N6)-methyltransferase [Mucilaginibacter sp.]